MLKACGNGIYLSITKCKITADSLSFNTILWLLVLGEKEHSEQHFLLPVGPQAIIGPFISMMKLNN